MLYQSSVIVSAGAEIVDPGLLCLAILALVGAGMTCGGC